jgi:asparagine synthase (glutamine-hydrolysing)
MCGIVGIIAKDKIGKSNFSQLKDAVNALYQRGPDAKGIFEHNNTGLGHARLSILDVSEGANQPLTSESGRYVLSFNGEIYNYKKLRQVLSNKGYTFKTTSDTEVLLNHLIEFGEKGIRDLNGFFRICFL